MHGLISEKVFPIDLGRWCVERRWDLKNPLCPMVRSPYHSGSLGSSGDVFVEQKILSAEEYEEIYGSETARVTPPVSKSWTDAQLRMTDYVMGLAPTSPYKSPYE